MSTYYCLTPPLICDERFLLDFCEWLVDGLLYHFFEAVSSSFFLIFFFLVTYELWRSDPVAMYPRNRCYFTQVLVTYENS